MESLLCTEPCMRHLGDREDRCACPMRTQEKTLETKQAPDSEVGDLPRGPGPAPLPLFLQLKDERTQSFILKDPSLQVSKRLHKMQQAFPMHDGRLKAGLAPPVPHCTSIPTMRVFPSVLLLPAPASASPSLFCSQPLFPETSPDFCGYWFGKVLRSSNLQVLIRALCLWDPFICRMQAVG